MTMVLSASERNLAVSGKSWMIQKDMNPAITVASPSRMKIHAQANLSVAFVKRQLKYKYLEWDSPGLPPIPCILEMAA